MILPWRGPGFYFNSLQACCCCAMGASLSGVANGVCCTRGDEEAARLVKNRCLGHFYLLQGWNCGHRGNRGFRMA